MRCAVDELIRREDRPYFIAVSLLGFAVGGAMLAVVSWRDSRPAPTRDQLKAIDGVVYAVNEQRLGKREKRLQFQMSTRTASGRSWTGYLLNCGIDERDLAALLGARLQTIRQLVGVPVKLLVHDAWIYEITANGELLFSYKEVPACNKP
jgi:hypothetical protein